MTREDPRLPYREGEIVFDSGRSRFADENGMPRVLRMKHKVKSSDLGDPTIELSRSGLSPDCQDSGCSIAYQAERWSR